MDNYGVTIKSHDPLLLRRFWLWYFIPYLHFLFLAPVDKTIPLPVFLLASIIFGFCIISYPELQSYLLQLPFKGVILVLTPHNCTLCIHF